MAAGSAPRRERRSAGLLPYRWAPAGLEVFLGHMGGPYWSGKDERAWSLIKGEPDDGEDDEAAAEREFVEETGLAVPAGPRLALGSVRQRSGKTVTAWAVEADLDASAAVSQTFELEWPPRSGRTLEVPEIDRFAWWPVPAARRLVVAAQADLLDRLVDALPDSRP